METHANLQKNLLTVLNILKHIHVHVYEKMTCSFTNIELSNGYILYEFDFKCVAFMLFLTF